MAIAHTIIAVSLLCVGFLSHTVIRHAIQVIPLVVMAVLSARRWYLTTAASLGILLFWFTIMVLIWLYLGDIARIVTGHYTPGEVALTVVIALTAAAGAVLVVGGRRSKTKTSTKLMVFAGALGIQAAMVALSYSKLLS